MLRSYCVSGTMLHIFIPEPMKRQKKKITNFTSVMNFSVKY